jgi:hypothetical protein
MVENENLPSLRTASGNEISFQAAQDLYYTLTGRSERINNFYYDHHCPSFEDFEQLHAIVEQAIEQYDCKISNLLITVRYSNGKSEKFSGIERFRTQALNRRNATEEVEFQYDFLIVLPKTQEAKPYKVIVSLRSTLATIQATRARVNGDQELDIMLRLAPATARLVIEYIDLAVARTFEAHIDEWYKSLRKIGRRANWLSAKLAGTAEVIIRSIALLFCAAALIIIVRDDVGEPREMFAAIVMSVAVLSVVRIVVFPVSHKVERWLRLVSNQCAIILSESDKALVDAYLKSPFMTWGKVVLQAALAIAYGLVAAALGAWIGL